MMNRQGSYSLPETGNTFDLVDGFSYHLSPISFYEFLSKPESLFFFDNTFFQIPQYELELLERDPIPDFAIEAVRLYIIRSFKRRLIGRQDYLAWSELFQNHLEEIRIPFWAQVNLQSLMTAQELEMDDLTTTRMNVGNSSSAGGQVVNSSQNSNQNTTNKQTTDSSARNANLTAVATGDIITDDLTYDWSEAANDFAEARTRAGDTTQETNAGGSANSKTDNTSSGQNSNISTETSEITNKQFTQERKILVETAQALMPLRWLKVQLEPCFWGLY